ncbi:MAG: Gfo/Idh/MocA family oxidoreductase [Flavobacteriales bacterium]|nr:Gfo/Idh/MocA family oxidoreductase [Flavobacteriales bacterium]
MEEFGGAMRRVDVNDAPTLAHHDCAMFALNAGKHVFIEKPIAKHLARSTEIADAPETTGSVQIKAWSTSTRHSWRCAGPGAAVFIETHRLATFDAREQMSA